MKTKQVVRHSVASPFQATCSFGLGLSSQIACMICLPSLRSAVLPQATCRVMQSATEQLIGVILKQGAYIIAGPVIMVKSQWITEGLHVVRWSLH